MADSTVNDLTKMKVVELRKELKSRGLTYAGDKAELVARLQAAMTQDDHGEINLDSDEIDSDGVLEDDEDKSHTDILDDSAVDTINEELALADNLSPVKETTESKPQRVLKRKITMSDTEKSAKNGDNVDLGSKKIVLNRATSITSATVNSLLEDSTNEKTAEEPKQADGNKVKITADVDAKTRMEMRAKRFGLPVKMTEAERKQARNQRFNHNSSSFAVSTVSTGSLSENLEKLKKRAERFGQNVSKIMTDIEEKEKLEKRKAKFNAPK